MVNNLKLAFSIWLLGHLPVSSYLPGVVCGDSNNFGQLAAAQRMRGVNQEHGFLWGVCGLDAQKTQTHAQVDVFDEERSYLRRNSQDLPRKVRGHDVGHSQRIGGEL